MWPRLEILWLIMTDDHQSNEQFYILIWPKSLKKEEAHEDIHYSIPCPKPVFLSIWSSLPLMPVALWRPLQTRPFAGGLAGGAGHTVLNTGPQRCPPHRSDNGLKHHCVNFAARRGYAQNQQTEITFSCFTKFTETEKQLLPSVQTEGQSLEECICFCLSWKKNQRNCCWQCLGQSDPSFPIVPPKLIQSRRSSMWIKCCVLYYLHRAQA